MPGKVMWKVNNIHLVGVGGAGMSGIAEVLVSLGYTVTGSDLRKTDITTRLASLGVKVMYSHIASNIVDCDVVVVSSAIDQNNVEIMAAQKRRIPIVPRAEMLAELMRFKQGIAIAGTHGKTTTTSLVATILAEGGLDPTFVVGGKLNNLHTNAKLGTGEYFVAEADESDASFLHLTPMMAVVTNVDSEHLVNYDNSFDKLKQTFIEFVHRLPFYGLAIVCIDDSNIQEMLPKLARSFLSYGFSERADVRAIDYQQSRATSSFKVLLPQAADPIEITLNLPGKHNALNALAAICVAFELGISINTIQNALCNFHGINRRFQLLGEVDLANKRVLVIDDYGHHPRELEMVIQAIYNGWPKRRLVMVYQPHRFTRTKELFSQFVKVLAMVDELLLLDIYAAGEKPIAGISSQAICDEVSKSNTMAKLVTKELLFDQLSKVVRDGDIVLMQGAGDIGKLSAELIKQFKSVVWEQNI